VRRLGLVSALISACATLAASAAMAQADVAWHPPSPSLVRYDEDWSGLADPQARTGRWTEAYKYIELPGRDAYLTTGLDVRLRDEAFRDNVWGGSPAPNDGYLWVRALPYADLHVGEFRAFVQPIVAYAVGVAPAASPVDETRVDLLQAFGEVTLPVGSATVTVRAGRQMMLLGSQRLVGARYGPNVPLAFDGARADLQSGSAQLSLFSVKPVQNGPGDFDDRSSRIKALWGAYATLPNLDLYYLGFRHRRATFGARTGDEHRDSFGVRSFGHAADWRWNVEGVLQAGRFDGRKIRAWTLGSEFGRKFRDVRFVPDATVRFNVISGDRDPGDGKLGTFNALFPKGKYFGELSPVGPYNIVNLNPGVVFDLGPKVSLSLSAMAYWRYSVADGVYDVPGNLIRAPGGSSARFIGKQVEALVDWQATPELDLSASLSAFDPGAFIRETGPAKTIRMVGLEADFRF
jgi:hypothetical protein